MLKKGLLLCSKVLSAEFDKTISAKITAATGYNSMAPDWVDYIGYMQSNPYGGTLGSCTDSEVTDFYDNLSNGNSPDSYFYVNVSDFFRKNALTLGRFVLYISGVEQYSCMFLRYSSSSTVNAMFTTFTTVLDFEPRYAIRTKAAYKAEESTIINCSQRTYPEMFNSDDLAWLLTQEGSDVKGLCIADKYYAPNSTTKDAICPSPPIYGLEHGKTYDFTLEYKIDAIITENGVQTF